MNNDLYLEILKETLDKKAQWLAMEKPYESALCYMLKKLHAKGLLLSSDEFSLYAIKQNMQRLSAA